MHKIFGCLILLLFSSVTHSLVILQYHHISDSTPPSTSLSPELFKQHLKYLKDNQFEVLGLDAVIKSLHKGEKFKDKTVVITFDDGYRSVYDTAFPLLRKYQFPFTIFVHTSPIEHQLNQFVSWKNLKDMSQYGASIANHTVHHQHLIKKNINDSPSQHEAMILTEILDSQRILEQKATNVLKALAYPYGEFDQQATAVVKSLGFIGFGQHSGALPAKPDLSAIPRFPFGGIYGGMQDFVVKINSLTMPIERVALLDQTGNEIHHHLLENEVKKPTFKIWLNKENQNLQIQCYSSKGNKLVRKVIQTGYEFTPEKNLPIGRSRYNCTAPFNIEGRFYWYSQPLILADEQGNYYRD
jgi:biofilm PGA synthesis lipoprotein PgaB